MVRFYKPTLKRKDMDGVLQTMVNEEIGPGESNRLFTQMFAERVKCVKGLSFRTYPDCIEGALKVLGVDKSSTVAISLLAPAVYGQVLKKIGCPVAYVDVDRENGLPDEQSVLSSGAEFLVLYESCGSLALKYNRETTYAEKVAYANLKILEDVSESIGGFYGEEYVPGDWGDAVISSFEDNNVVSCAGGAAFAVKKDYVQALRSYVKGNSEENEGEETESEPVVFSGDYIRMTDLNASLGAVQLQNLDSNCERSRKICQRYTQKLMQTRHKAFGLTLVDFNSSASCFAVFLDSKPEDSIKFAARNGIPLIRTFKDSICSVYEGDLFADFPNSAAYFFRTVSFPVYPFLKDTEIDLIAKVIGHLL